MIHLVNHTANLGCIQQQDSSVQFPESHPTKYLPLSLWPAYIAFHQCNLKLLIHDLPLNYMRTDSCIQWKVTVLIPVGDLYEIINYQRQSFLSNSKFPPGPSIGKDHQW